MPCYHPLAGWYSKERNPSGLRSVTFDRSSALIDRPVTVPCGQCIGCRLERSRQWAVRCVHEAKMHDKNCFVTLTYAPEHCPESLQHDDFQRFVKRFRKKFFGNSKSEIRYYMCGEYGEQLARPHYHACIFGFDFPDKKLWSVRDGVNLYRSEMLESLWTYGYSTIGEVTFESAAYVARYVTKKITGEGAEAHYQGRAPEYTTMSRRPGIGTEWLKKFKSDVYPADIVIVRGKKCKPARFYDNLFDSIGESGIIDFVKRNRKKSAERRLQSHPNEAWYGRLAEREKFQQLKQKQKGERKYETGRVCSI